MNTTTSVNTAIPNALSAHVLARVLAEGYGPGAWHGPDMKAALAEVSPQLAFWRPSPARHSIAEIALHHAYCTRSVRGRLSGAPLEPFVMEGDDWFALPGQPDLTWAEIRTVLEEQQHRLAALVASLGTHQAQSPLTEAEQFDLVVGITCHAVYHAGQVQLVRRLHAG